MCLNMAWGEIIVYFRVSNFKWFFFYVFSLGKQYRLSKMADEDRPDMDDAATLLPKTAQPGSLDFDTSDNEPLSRLKRKQKKADQHAKFIAALWIQSVNPTPRTLLLALW